MLVPRNVFQLYQSAGDHHKYGIAGIRFERQQDGTPIAVVTDGCLLIATTWSEDLIDDYPGVAGETEISPLPGFAKTIPRNACRKAIQLAKPGKRLLSAKPILGNVVITEKADDKEAGENTILIMASNLETVERQSVREVEGRFPKWREHIPDFRKESRDTVSVKIDPHILKQACEAMIACTNDEDEPSIVLTVAAGAGEPIYAESPKGPLHDHAPMILSASQNDGRKVIAVIMPRKVQDHNKKPLPIDGPAWIPRPDG